MFGETKRAKPRSKSAPSDKPRKPRVTSWVPLDDEGHPVTELDDAAMTRLRERSMNLCVWHLGNSAKTTAQLRTTMARKNVPEGIVEETLERLVGLGYLDDNAYAEAYVRSAHNASRKGARAIASGLRAKGVPDDVAQAALAEVDPDSERSNALALATSKIARTRDLDSRKRVQRVVGMLARKGYSLPLAFEVTRQALDADGQDTEDLPTGEE